VAQRNQRSTAPTASQRIADQLRERILSGELAPGTRIIQDDVAEELDSSRLPVREALHILQSAGLVVMKSNLGAWVSRMDLRDCEVSYKIRERLEPLLLAESMHHLTEAEFDELDRIQDEIETTEDVNRFLVLDRRLHWATYQGNGVAELEAIVARLWDTTQHYRRAFTLLTGRKRQWVINGEHRLLIDAVRRGDQASAEQILALHIRRTRVELSHHPEVFESGV
jgi:DNA-binding GntR family transcriptional regulator